MRGPAWFAQKAGKRDKNHRPIVKALEQLGYLVADLGGAAGGVSDIAVRDCRRWAAGRWEWVEIKMPGEDLTPAQRELHARWLLKGVKIHIAESLDDVLRVVASEAA